LRGPIRQAGIRRQPHYREKSRQHAKFELVFQLASIKSKYLSKQKRFCS
jgi:hypothetical protein